MPTPLSKPPADPLAALRDRLDRVDIELHRLLRERFEIVAEIGRAKGEGESVLRPAREAAVLENRLAVHTGAMPREVLAHVWRVLIAAGCSVQRPYAMHVCGALDAARFLYGPIPAHAHASASDAVAALGGLPGDIAVVAQGGERWWASRGPAHAIGVVPLSDGTRAAVLGGAGIARGSGPAALVARAGTLIEIRTGELLPGDDLIGRFHPFPVTIPVAR